MLCPVTTFLVQKKSQGTPRYHTARDGFLGGYCVGSAGDSEPWDLVSLFTMWALYFLCCQPYIRRATSILVSASSAQTTKSFT